MNLPFASRVRPWLAGLAGGTCSFVCGASLLAAAPVPPAKGAAAKDASAAKAPATAATNQPPAMVKIPKSAFTDQINFGKDPFFPVSARRMPPPPPPQTNVVVNPAVSPQTQTNATTHVVTPPPPSKKALASSFLSLKGVSIGKVKSVFLSTSVKFYDIRLGEEMRVRVPEYGAVLIKCVEIKDRSVILKVEGEDEPVELRLRPGL